MDFVLCLSHYCEAHGPQSILCTQAIPEPCQSCETTGKSSIQNEYDPGIPHNDVEDITSQLSSSFGEGLLLDQHLAHDHTLTRSPTFRSAEPPHIRHLNSTAPTPKVDESVKACSGCSMRVPRRIEKKPLTAKTGYTNSNDEEAHRNPILRTRSSLAVPFLSFDPESSAEIDEDACASDDQDGSAPPMTRGGSRVSSGSDGSPPDIFNARRDFAPRSVPDTHAKDADPTTISSTHIRPEASLLSPKLHNHYLNYFSTGLPTDSSTFIPLRQSIIRALSLENLPRGCDAGPLVFGSGSRGQHHDALGHKSNGYAIAYIFRLPDLQARGHRRTYALIAMPQGVDQSNAINESSSPTLYKHPPHSPFTRERSFSNTTPTGTGHLRAARRGSGLGNYTNNSEARAGATMATVTAAFGKIASWITELVERKQHAERATAEEAEAAAQAELAQIASKESGGKKIPQFKVTPTSSFLSAKRVDPDGYPRQKTGKSGGVGSGAGRFGQGGVGKSEFWKRHGVQGEGPSSLTEMTGREDFFVELHAAFVRLILALR